MALRRSLVLTVAATAALVLLLALSMWSSERGGSGHHPASGMKIYAAGSGEDMMSDPSTAREIVHLAGKATPHLVYLGTATYDAPKSEHHQTKRFVELGCTVTPIKMARHHPDMTAVRREMEKADIVLVSGGNTLYAVDRWKALGVDRLIHEAGRRGAVLAGGSAGGIVWFDGGHSDSMDPTTYIDPPGPLLKSSLSKDVLSKSWAYIRVPGLSLLPGLFCPHYDKVEGNGELRAKSFTTMMQMHSGETGIAIDNWAAIVVEGNKYRVVSRKGKPGSAAPGGHYQKPHSQSGGKPGAFVIEIGPDGRQKRHALPKSGSLGELGAHARYITGSPFLHPARVQNPVPKKDH